MIVAGTLEHSHRTYRGHHFRLKPKHIDHPHAHLARACPNRIGLIVTTTSPTPHQPLAERLRPKSLAEVVGQQHLLGEGMALRLAFESGQPHSCIFWGPPGTGKTTIARLMADAFDAHFHDQYSLTFTP